MGEKNNTMYPSHPVVRLRFVLQRGGALLRHHMSGGFFRLPIGGTLSSGAGRTLSPFLLVGSTSFLFFWLPFLRIVSFGVSRIASSALWLVGIFLFRCGVFGWSSSSWPIVFGVLSFFLLCLFLF